MASSPSLAQIERDARDFFRVAVQRVQADRLLHATGREAWAPERLDRYDRIRVVGMGKAAMAMAGVVEEQLPGGSHGGVVVVPEGYPSSLPDRLPSPSSVHVIQGGHPLPSEGSARAGRRLLEQAEAVGKGDLLFVLVSGGGTALSSLPVEALDVPDLKTTYHRLLNGGVPIEPANVVRKHLTQVGGGQLARTAHPAGVEALVVSDVVGNDLATIASGPTVPDPSTYEEAVEVLYRHGLWHDVPDSVREHLADGARGRRSETPSADDSCFDGTRTRLVGSNEKALDAARRAAEQRGYEVEIVTSGMEGEAEAVAREHVQAMMSSSPDRPTCWLWGGETTVTVTGEGRGGRNQESALAAALEMEAYDGPAVFLSGGTDGIDGPTDAAGAWATPDTSERARRAGCDPSVHLADNDAYPFFEAIDQLLRPGPTHTNVMDVQVGIMSV